ncbi:unnamed protein product [Rangifer tarandus platyrhynchus]|uniref:Uncharacterized protein n=1 Tax=Rangifer tarandus platyrhynchus TaxID=3082113 RepID=A0AC60A1P0_RANTA
MRKVQSCKGLPEAVALITDLNDDEEPARTSLSRKKARTHGAICRYSEAAATCGGHLGLAGGLIAPPPLILPSPQSFQASLAPRSQTRRPEEVLSLPKVENLPKDILTGVIPALATFQQPRVNSLNHRRRDPRLGRPSPPAPPPSLSSRQLQRPTRSLYPVGTLGECSPKG